MGARMPRRMALVLLATLVVVMVAASAVGNSAPRRVQNTNNFDLVWSQTDMNGIPFRPKWRWQLFHSGAPDPQQYHPIVFGFTALTCTSQTVATDNAATCLLPDFFPGGGQKLNGMSGHRNWRAATYDGELFWGSHSSSLMDDDYNFRLLYLTTI